MEYSVEIVTFGELPELSEQNRNTIIVGRSGVVDKCVRFFCHCEKATPIYIPFGKWNLEGGNDEVRSLEWEVPDKVLTIKPSIKLKTGCYCHFHLVKNKTT